MKHKSTHILPQQNSPELDEALAEEKVVGRSEEVPDDLQFK